MKIGIIGGGYLGLTAAYELGKRGIKVVIFEKEKELGGLAGILDIGTEWPIEKYYHHIFTTDKDIIGLSDELGVGEEDQKTRRPEDQENPSRLVDQSSSRLKWYSPKMGVFAKSKVYPFATAKDAIKFNALSLAGRVRFGAVTLLLKRVKDYKKFEKIKAIPWIKKKYGEEVYNLIWGPLIQSKFSEYADQISMAWFWGRVKTRGQSRKNGKEVLGYWDGGLATFQNALIEAVKKQGAEIRTNSNIEKVVISRGSTSTEKEVEPQVIGILADKKQFILDGVIATTPDQTLTELTGKIYKPKESILHEGMICPILVLKHSLSNIYWMNISDPEMPFGGLIEHTNFIDKKHYGGKVIVYLSKYIPHDHRYFKMSDKEVLDEFLPHLKKINPDFKKSWVEKSFVVRDKFAQPIITTNYSEKIPKMETGINGLYLANMSMIYPEDRGTNFAVKLGKQVAKLINK